MKQYIKISRKKYLDELIDCINTPVIKIIKGIRGSGKSEIMCDFKEYLLKKYPDSNVIYFSLEDYPNSLITTHNVFFDALTSKIKPNVKNFILLDEIQSINQFEVVILHFWKQKNCDLYITGSNSYLLSGQIATKFTRRNYEINVEPFTLSEVIEFKRINNISCDIKEVYLEYCRYGGLPQIYYFENPDNRIKQLNKIYSEIIEKDVLPNKTINNYLEFKRILKFVCENIGNTFSSQTIFDVIDSENHANTVSKNTIYDYVKTMCNVLLINDVQKINVIGKELLKLNAKYYMQDIGIRNAILGNPTDIYFPKLLENIVYLELKSRGYSVNIGKIHRSEIDFIATKGDTCVYIQICEYLTSKEKIEQELAPFSLAKNHYRKIVIVGEKTNFSTYNGVEIIPICDFLLNWK